MKGYRYYWDRRKVVKRTAKNLLEWILREPFRSKGKTGDLAIIFVCQNARARIFNVAHPLRKNENVRTILFSQVFEYKYQSKAFDNIYLYRDYADLENKIKRLADRYNILAAVGSTEPIRQSRILIDMARKWPVLIDQFDSYWSSFHFAGIDVDRDKKFAHMAEEIKEEKYCFSKAEGVIARTGELPLLFQQEKVPTQTLLYEDGCDSDCFQPIRQVAGPKNKEWSVVYPGIFYPMTFDPQVYASAQLVPLGKLFAREKIHFHLYPSPIHDYQYPEYLKEAARNPYFHMHPSVDFSKIQKEISEYDFGWYANNYLKYGFTSEIYRKYAVATKVCTYLEAGLPVISNGLHLRSADIIRKNGCGLLVDVEAPKGLRSILEKQDLPALLEGVRKARAKMDVNKRSGELFSFIKAARNRFA